MTVRFRLALTVVLAGLFTAVGVIATLVLAFQRFEHEHTYARADAFLGRVVGMVDDLLDQQQRNPQELTPFLRNLLLFEPDSQLYLLSADGTVLAHTGQVVLPPGFKVALGPVQQSAAGAVDAQARMLAPYVMGDDPEHMDADAVVAARALQRAQIRPADGPAGYLYLVCRKSTLRGAGNAMFGSSLLGPALVAVLLLIVAATALAVWVIGTVTRPLRVLSAEVATASRDGFSGRAQQPVEAVGAELPSHDEFGQLRQGFRTMLATLRMQWDALQRLDSFRRESVSNLSHDLRSPLTATVACLETLEQRWAGQAGRSDDRALVQVALRNTRNAAGMVRSLGDLALLDEPAFQLHPVRLDLAEMLDDIVLRFAERAARQGVALRFEAGAGAGVSAALGAGAEGRAGGALEVADTAAVGGTEGAGPAAGPIVVDVDVELFERAVANLLDNALKHTPAGASVTLRAARHAGQVQVQVDDAGRGIAAADVPRLFDRLYQARDSVAPASSEEGRGLGLAIVKRIVELHRGAVAVASTPGQGTCVTITLPAA